MRAFLQKVPSTGRAAFNLLAREDDSFPFAWHFHPEYELTLIVHSRGQRLVGNSIADYGPGDLVLLGPDLPHSWRSSPMGDGAKHSAIVVQFRRDFLGCDFLGLPEAQPIKQLLDRSAEGLAFKDSPEREVVIALMIALPLLSAPRRLAGLIEILARLAGQKNAARLSTGPSRPVYRVAEQQRIDAICSFLEKKYRSPIDHIALTRTAKMDHGSLCRFFKRATGRTVTAYVNELRVGTAARLLVETDQSVLAIGYAVGFGNHANFCRQFGRLKGISPGRFRREFRS